jgi:hypothetical protein
MQEKRAPSPIEHHECPADVTERLRLAGGINRFGEPNFRVVWGYDRIIKLHGEWQEFEQYMATLTDKLTGYAETRPLTRLVRSVVETREVPKYTPANCWHLEKWRPPEEYGSPQQWRARGLEHTRFQTVDTSGPYPERGEYERCYPLTHDGTINGTPIPLVADVVEEIVNMIRLSGEEKLTYLQRRAAIMERVRREDEGFVAQTEDILREALPAFHGQEYVVRP